MGSVIARWTYTLKVINKLTSIDFEELAHELDNVRFNLTQASTGSKNTEEHIGAIPEKSTPPHVEEVTEVSF